MISLPPPQSQALQRMHAHDGLESMLVTHPSLGTHAITSSLSILSICTGQVKTFFFFFANTTVD